MTSGVGSGFGGLFSIEISEDLPAERIAELDSIAIAIDSL
jgi:hypothetical protein